VRAARDRRNEAIFERLAALGVPVTHEEVAVHVRGRILARPHFGRALVARGHVPDLRTAFSQYLRDGGPAYVQAKSPSPEEAVRAIRAAGGAAVVAHPGQIRLKQPGELAAFLASMRAAGLAGIEVWHPSHDPDQRALVADLARRHDLLPSGGSDFHGDNKPHIRLGAGDGTIEVHRDTWDRLSERRGPSWS
jgi:predicted metal-dependent phosphoesterase TrpH